MNALPSLVAAALPNNSCWMNNYIVIFYMHMLSCHTYLYILALRKKKQSVKCKNALNSVIRSDEKHGDRCRSSWIDKNRSSGASMISTDHPELTEIAIHDTSVAYFTFTYILTI